MRNRQASDIFNEIATILELKGDNPFRVRAYRRAALTVGGLPKDIASMSEEELRAVPGLGADLVGQIRRFVDTGRIDLHEELKAKTPPGLLEILRISGVGPKTARMLHEKLGAADVGALEKLARGGKLRGLPGIQGKAEENILKGIEALKRGRDRHPLGGVLPAADEIVSMLRDRSPVGRIAVAGSIRRWKETVKDADILATSKNPAEVMKAFVGLPAVVRILENGSTKSSIVTREGLQVDLRVVEEESFGAALQYFTGSRQHNIRLREMAARAGLKLNEYGVFRASDGKRLGGREEEEIYALLGLPPIPPELREDSGEIEAAREGRLPDLVTRDAIRGDLHVHTRWSDGGHDVPAIVEAARKRGYRYVASTDHSKGLGVARGLDEKRLREQLRLVAGANAHLKGFRVLSGIEVDVRSDGSLDLPDELLAELDVVVASVHSGFRQGRERLTRRLLSAVRNPCVAVIAHPTGRLLGEREPYEVDMEALLDEAAKRGVAMEVNANPSRLDLNDLHVRMAVRRRVPLVISTDMHVLANLDHVVYGVATARRGWAESGDVLNTLGVEALLRRLRKRPRPGRRRSRSR